MRRDPVTVFMGRGPSGREVGSYVEWKVTLENSVESKRESRT